MKLEDIIKGTYSYKNGKLYVDGNVDLGRLELKEIPYDFHYVSGWFDCEHNQLTSLAGCPKKIGRSFDCDDNQLTSLAGCPKEIGGYFNCRNNQLTSLEGCPKIIGEWFDCNNNQLVSLAGCPKEIGGSFDCNNNQLVSLAGCPKKIDGWFDCRNNPYLVSLDEINDDIRNKLVLDYEQLERINEREKIKYLLNI